MSDRGEQGPLNNICQHTVVSASLSQELASGMKEEDTMHSEETPVNPAVSVSTELSIDQLPSTKAVSPLEQSHGIGLVASAAAAPLSTLPITSSATGTETDLISSSDPSPSSLHVQALQLPTSQASHKLKISLDPAAANSSDSLASPTVAVSLLQASSSSTTFSDSFPQSNAALSNSLLFPPPIALDRKFAHHYNNNHNRNTYPSAGNSRRNSSSNHNNTLSHEFNQTMTLRYLSPPPEMTSQLPIPSAFLTSSNSTSMSPLDSGSNSLGRRFSANSDVTLTSHFSQQQQDLQQQRQRQQQQQQQQQDQLLTLLEILGDLSTEAMISAAHRRHNYYSNIQRLVMVPLRYTHSLKGEYFSDILPMELEGHISNVVFRDRMRKLNQELRQVYWLWRGDVRDPGPLMRSFALGLAGAVVFGLVVVMVVAMNSLAAFGAVEGVCAIVIVVLLVVSNLYKIKAISIVEAHVDQWCIEDRMYRLRWRSVRRDPPRLGIKFHAVSWNIAVDLLPRRLRGTDNNDAREMQRRLQAWRRREQRMLNGGDSWLWLFREEREARDLAREAGWRVDDDEYEDKEGELDDGEWWNHDGCAVDALPRYRITEETPPPPITPLPPRVSPTDGGGIEMTELRVTTSGGMNLPTEEGVRESTSPVETLVSGGGGGREI